MGRVRSVSTAGRWLLVDGGLALGTVVALCVMVAIVGTTPWLGIFAIPLAARLNRTLATAQRGRVGRRTNSAVEATYRTGPASGRIPVLSRYLGLIGRTLTEPMTYRDAGWVVLHTAVACTLIGWMLALAAAFAAPVWWWATPLPAWPAVVLPLVALAGLATLPVVADASARLAVVALSPPLRAQLAARVAELTVTRAEALDAHEAELRRIERDLHDGAQGRLVSATLRIGIAERRAGTDPAAVGDLLSTARTDIEHALADIRTVVRSMYPPVLADRGLEGAIAALTAGGPVPVHVELTQVGRRPAAVESAAYHVIAEALANVSRHSQATSARVVVHGSAEVLHIEVSDDGHGGADPDRGTGLAGVRRRVAAFDGTTDLSSPVGGPTTLSVLLPGRV